MKAGLGGGKYEHWFDRRRTRTSTGSSNAATALWAANKLTGKKFSTEYLKKWGADLGSDVPFFFSGGTALCTVCVVWHLELKCIHGLLTRVEEKKSANFLVCFPPFFISFNPMGVYQQQTYMKIWYVSYETRLQGQHIYDQKNGWIRTYPNVRKGNLKKFLLPFKKELCGQSL